MKTAVTLSCVDEAKAGPFVFHGDLARGFAAAKLHGFDAVELFLPAADHTPLATIQRLQHEHGLAVAAIGTGAGMVKHGLTLTDPDAGIRQRALDFVLSFVDLGAALQAPAILGSMQGKHSSAVSCEQAMQYLSEALTTISVRAGELGQIFLYEPLNRYETNLFNRLGDAAEFLHVQQLKHVKLLADLFHMNIEENSLEEALTLHINQIGHIHFADSNRQAIGFGHTDGAALLRLLQKLDYRGYLSAEILPLPSPAAAAAQFISSTTI